MQATCKEYSKYFRGMTGKTDTRSSRGYSFTFDADTDKARFHALAKRRGTNLANLIKMLLVEDEAKHPAPTK